MPRTRIDDYLSHLPDDKRAALERLRAQVKAVAPDATETIGYGMPAFRIGERYVVGFGATGTACSFYVGRAPLQGCASDLQGYRTWKGTINFTPDRPIPDALVEKLVRCRLAECRRHEPGVWMSREGQLLDPEVVEHGEGRCVDPERVEVDVSQGVEASEAARLTVDDG